MSVEWSIKYWWNFEGEVGFFFCSFCLNEFIEVKYLEVFLHFFWKLHSELKYLTVVLYQSQVLTFCLIFFFLPTHVISMAKTAEHSLVVKWLVIIWLREILEARKWVSLKFTFELLSRWEERKITLVLHFFFFKHCQLFHLICYTVTYILWILLGWPKILIVF